MDNEFLDAGFLSAEEAEELWKEGEVVDPDPDPENPENPEEHEKTDETEKEKHPATEEETEKKPPESVGSEEKQGAKDTTPEGEGSPDYSSIAQAFKEVGVLQTLDDEKLEAELTRAVQEEDYRLASYIKEELNRRKYKNSN